MYARDEGRKREEEEEQWKEVTGGGGGGSEEEEEEDDQFGIGRREGRRVISPSKSEWSDCPILN